MRTHSSWSNYSNTIQTTPKGLNASQEQGATLPPRNDHLSRYDYDVGGWLNLYSNSVQTTDAGYRRETPVFER